VNVRSPVFRTTLPNSPQLSRGEVWGHVIHLGAGWCSTTATSCRDRGSKTNNGHVTAAAPTSGSRTDFSCEAA
jgi:hypothetical protein